MDPIEIRIKIIVSKEGDIQIVHEHGREERYVDSVPPFQEEVGVSHPVVPVYEFICRRYEAQVGKKEAGTCHGCTVQCHMKGKYDPIRKTVN